MINVGITGQSGFIGTHLCNYLGLYPDKFRLIAFQDDFFEDELKLQQFVSQCNTIVHLAAINRHEDPNFIYDTNLLLVKKIIDTCEKTGSKPQIIFSSSTQEEKDNLYGRSKREGRILFEKWAKKENSRFTGLIIPNVFGPFGRPYYNSVVATFCFQLTHDEIPKIETDGVLNLIYVGELVQEIIYHIQNPQLSYTSYHVKPTYSLKVTQLLNKLLNFKEAYLIKGILPSLSDPFERNLFNTFLCYIDHEKFYPFRLDMKSDNRGTFTEIIKFSSGGQVSFSITKPGINRGNHFHTRKAERFAVIKGKARIKIRRIGTEKIISFDIDGSNPSFVDMPIWYTHNITNIGIEDLYTIFWISEHYNPDDPDTFFNEVET